MNRNRLLLVVGVVALGLGLAAWTGALAFGFDRAVVVLVGVLALVQALRVADARRHVDRRTATTPEPEVGPSVPAPGDDLRDALRQFTDTHYVFRRTLVRDGLEAAAVAVLTRYGDLTEAEARDRIEAGTWTGDASAAAFLGGDDVPDPPLSAQLGDLLARESATRRNVRRTVDAIAAVAGIAPRTDGDSGAGLLSRFGLRFGGDDGADSARTGGASSASADDDRSREQSYGAEHRLRRETNRWYGVSVIALVGIGAGVLAEQPGVVLVGVVGICYAAYARSNDVAEVALSVERSLDDERPEPGDPVEVTVAVTNEGEGTLPDVRLVDGVPGALPVDDGSPRTGTTLRPGETATVSYAVTARRGVHEFDPLLAVVRNLPGTVEHERTVAPDSPTEITCIPTLRPLPVSVPLREDATRYTGTEDTSSGGEGTEFFATRSYRPGDSMSRVDWNRRARTGELATLVFREERTATVVLVIDTFPSAYVAPDPHAEHAVDRAVDAAGQVFATVADAGNRVGVATVGTGDCWLSPGSGTAHRSRARELLATHPALNAGSDGRPDVSTRSTEKLRRRLPSTAQLVLFSPLCRTSTVRTARRLEAAGHPVTVVSPDPTADRTPGQRLARVARRVGITDLRRAGVPVIDWAWDEPLAVALARAPSVHRRRSAPGGVTR